MPSETLTKHRLAQIIITLAILVAAFTWRTLTHSDVVTMHCVANPTCSLDVNGKTLTVTKGDTNYDGYLLYPVHNEWTIKPEGQRVGDGKTVLMNKTTQEITILELGIKIRIL